MGKSKFAVPILRGEQTALDTHKVKIFYQITQTFPILFPHQMARIMDEYEILDAKNGNNVNLTSLFACILYVHFYPIFWGFSGTKRCMIFPNYVAVKIAKMKDEIGVIIAEVAPIFIRFWATKKSSP